jgi:Ca-activated chloride channel family protein
MASIAIGAGDAPPGFKASSAAEAVVRGKAAYEEGRLEEALDAFKGGISLAPRSPVPLYNAAATSFQLKQFVEARQLYLEARQRAGGALRVKIDYALGNAALALGDIPGAISAYDACLASTAGGEALEPVRLDAAINRRFALEQAQSLAIPQEQDSGGQDRAKRADRGRTPRRGSGDETSPDGQPETEPAAGGAGPENAGDGDRARPRSRPRRSGGAGGGTSSQRGAPGDSPEDRLDAAIEQIRANQSRRLPEEPPPASANDDYKDW